MEAKLKKLNSTKQLYTSEINYTVQVYHYKFKLLDVLSNPIVILDNKMYVQSNFQRLFRIYVKLKQISKLSK